MLFSLKLSNHIINVLSYQFNMSYCCYLILSHYRNVISHQIPYLISIEKAHHIPTDYIKITAIESTPLWHITSHHDKSHAHINKIMSIHVILEDMMPYQIILHHIMPSQITSLHKSSHHVTTYHLIMPYRHKASHHTVSHTLISYQIKYIDITICNIISPYT